MNINDIPGFFDIVDKPMGIAAFALLGSGFVLLIVSVIVTRRADSLTTGLIIFVIAAITGSVGITLGNHAETQMRRDVIESEIAHIYDIDIDIGDNQLPTDPRDNSLKIRDGDRIVELTMTSDDHLILVDYNGTEVERTDDR